MPVCAPCKGDINKSAHSWSDSRGGYKGYLCTYQSELVLLYLCHDTKHLLSLFLSVSLFLAPAPTSAAMTELEKCMESLIVMFHRYAEAGGDGNTLSKKELKKLLENELPTFVKVKLFHLLSPLYLQIWPLVLPHLLSLIVLFFSRPRKIPSWSTA